MNGTIASLINPILYTNLSTQIQQVRFSIEVLFMHTATVNQI